MGGKELTQILDKILVERGISRLKFCDAIGISSAAYSNWKNGGKPRDDKIAAIEQYLNINLSDYEAAEDSESAEVLQWLREDFSHRALFESAKGLTKEQAYAAASFIEKLKAGDT